jgi:UDP-glucose 4-epimerase
MYNVLITGGAGFIGSYLTEALIAEGCTVTIIDDLSTGSLNNIDHLMNSDRFHFAIETITNETVMDRLVSECDIIFHLAAAVGVELIIKKPVHVIETNILGTEYVLRIANRYRKKVLIASSSEIYGKSNCLPFKEDDDRILGPTIRNRWSYSCSKAMDEFLALAYWHEKKLPVTIFRLFNTVGPRQTGRYGMVVPRFVHQALSGEPITIFGSGIQSRCFANVKDVVQAIIALSKCSSAVGEVYNVGTDEEITIIDLANKIKSLIGSDSEIKLIPYDEAYEKGFEDMFRRVPDIQKIKNAIGWTPKITLDNTLKEIISYIKDKEVK